MGQDMLSLRSPVHPLHRTETRPSKNGRSASFPPGGTAESHRAVHVRQRNITGAAAPRHLRAWHVPLAPLCRTCARAPPPRNPPGSPLTHRPTGVAAEGHLPRHHGWVRQPRQVVVLIHACHGGEGVVRGVAQQQLPQVARHLDQRAALAWGRGEGEGGAEEDVVLPARAVGVLRCMQGGVNK